MSADRRFKAKQKSGPLAEKKTSSKKVQDVTASALVEQGNAAVASFQPELALRFYQRALEKEPNDTNIMDALADVHLQLGNPQEAQELLLQSTQQAPTTNAFKWLYLAQLQQGTESLSCYLRAIDVLQPILLEVTSIEGDIGATARTMVGSMTGDEVSSPSQVRKVR